MHPPIRYVSLAGSVLLVLGSAAAYLRRRRRKSSAELERERRTYIIQHGRIIDGTVLDFHEVANPEAPDSPTTLLLLYRYEISGIRYEAAQDVSDLRQYVDVHSCRLGLPASVRYDPHGPENSIVVSETWSGLRLNKIHGKIESSSDSPSTQQNSVFP